MDWEEMDPSIVNNAITSTDIFSIVIYLWYFVFPVVTILSSFFYVRLSWAKNREELHSYKAREKNLLF